MIVLRRLELWRRDLNPAGHSEMDAEPIVAGKLEEHAFTAAIGTEIFRVDQSVAQVASLGLAKDAIPRMQCNIDNHVAAAGVPLFAIPVDFGELGHRAEYVLVKARQRWIALSERDFKSGSKAALKIGRAHV